MDFLRVNGDKIVDESGNAVYLRGVCIGGWMNFEDFINAYPGAESTIRKSLAAVIGEKTASRFFDILVDNFFAEDDIRFLAEHGVTCLRLPLNYRHFESDLEPYQYNEDAFARLEKAVKLCEKHGIYVILDMHAAQGWQNCHWHSDNERGAALLWTHKLFQDRLAELWKELARRFSGYAAVAGYELLNEPNSGNPDGEHAFDFYGRHSPGWDAINGLYRRLVNDIREIDPKHIIVLQGDNYGRSFDGFEAPFAENLVYSSHNYTAPGYGPGKYPGEYGSDIGESYWDKNRHRREFVIHQGTRFAEKHKVPLLVGEFGSQYHGLPEDLDDRIRSMKDQISVYNEWGAHWTAWTYKDAGVMGWVTLDPKSEYMRIVEPVQKMKRELGAENFVACYGSCPGREKSRELADMILRVSGGTDLNPGWNAYTMNYAVLTGYAAAMLQPAWAKRFEGATEEDAARILEAFEFKNCIVNKPLMELIKQSIKP